MPEPTQSPPSYFDPPSFDPPSFDFGLDEAGSADLPIYTRRVPPPPREQRHREPKEFPFKLTRKGKLCAVLTMLGDHASSTTMPSILEGSDVAGSVKLTLESGDAIQAVVISVRGQIITGAGPGEQFTFLDLTKTLWSQTMGDPRNPSSSVETKYKEKLRGEYQWTFSIPLPKEIVLPAGPKKDPQIFRLPETFIERHTRASVQYDLSLRLARGKLKIDDKIQAIFGYIPITRPGPPSLLRRLAYQESTALWGPEADPEGWHTLPSVQCGGKVFAQRTAEVKCALSLALPLCYTRGSVIPCSIIIETNDQQALDLLASPKSIVLRMRRCVKCHPNPEKSIESLAWRDTVEHSQLAAWWSSPVEIGADNSSRRRLDGELHLPTDMKPTSAVANYRIEYSVVLFPFDAIAFEPATSDVLCAIDVDITTAYALGPRPRTYTPPGYEAGRASTDMERIMLLSEAGGF